MPGWRNGRRSGLKIRRSNPWGFKSPLRHQCQYGRRYIKSATGKPVDVNTFKTERPIIFKEERKNGQYSIPTDM